jgi:hypothetical protein
LRFRHVAFALGLLMVVGVPLRAQLQPSLLRWERLSDTAFDAAGSTVVSPSLNEATSLLSADAASRLGPDSAALLGGVIGAAVGYTALYFYCKDRFCEMWPVIGIVGGAVVGSSIGRVLAMPSRPSPRPR